MIEFNYTAPSSLEKILKQLNLYAQRNKEALYDK
jgi:hypothetical protein